MKIKLITNNRGFKYGEFKDIYGADCSIQKSSLADKDALWIGCDKGDHIRGNCLARMHIDRELAKELVRHLKKFIRTGNI